MCDEFVQGHVAGCWLLVASYEFPVSRVYFLCLVPCALCLSLLKKLLPLLPPFSLFLLELFLYCSIAFLFYKLVKMTR